jgi:hypothetical protein
MRLVLAVDAETLFVAIDGLEIILFTNIAPPSQPQFARFPNLMI